MGASHSLPTEHSTIEAKTSGEGHQRQGTAIRKIAFRRATSRANRAGIAQYRGRTMRAAQYNPQPQSPNIHTASGPARPMRHPPTGRNRITVMSYNAGGLSTHHYAELLAWLHIQKRRGQAPDIVMVQETHWLGEQDYSNDAWHVLATGCDRQHSGLLIMLAKAAFPAVVIRKEVAIPGRVLAVRIQQDHKVLNLVNVYQKVWNGTHEAKQIRTQVLDALQKRVRQAPSRYPLIVAGDFNASLDHRSPCVGSAVISGSHAAGLPDVDRLHGLLKQFDLRALNTFNPQPHKHTFTSYDDRKSQIDYIFVRARSADATAKAPQVLQETRLAQWKTGSVHHPIIANIPHRFWHSSSRPAQLSGNRARAPTGRLALEADKNGFLMTVDSALRQMNVWDTKAVNATLAAAAEQFLVTNRPPRSTRPTTAEQPVKHMWNMYRRLQAAKRTGANSEVLAEHHTAFKQAQRTVRDFSKNKRLQFLEDQLKAAAAASDRGDIRALHVIINKVAPKTRRPRPQIRNEEGRMVSPTCELKLIKDFWQQIYTSDFPIELNEPGTLALDADRFAQALAKLPSYKSLPGQYAPSIVWKLASRPIADLLQRTIFEAWQRDSIKVPQEWRDAWLALILKPSKSGKHPSDYRPIGLTDPIGKTVLGMIRQQHEPELYMATLHLPQFAYIRHRGTAQAIARAFEHVHHAHALLMDQKLTLSSRKAGAKPEQLTGAITVSIDLSKAFDSLEPVIMQRALDHSALPQSVKELILQWHHGLSYHLQHERLTGSVQCQRGIRQGCRIAPSIWALFTALAMQEIDAEWCKQHSTWYADDTLFQAIFHNEHQLRQTLEAIAKALCVLKALGMTISTSKCAVLLELRGTKAKKAKTQVLTQHQQRLHLVVEHAGTQWRLPVVSKLDYLGAVLSYHKPKDATVDRRLQASRAAFERLRPVLTNRNLPLRIRVRLWETCVVCTMVYSLPQVGLTLQGAAKLSVLFHRQLRHITRTPVHIGFTSNQCLRHQHGLVHPLEAIATRAAGQVQTTTTLHATLQSQDARLHPSIVQAEERVAQELQDLVQNMEEPREEDTRPLLTCNACGFQTRGSSVLARHCVKYHSRSKRPLNHQTWKAVNRLDHAKGGLPICRWCDHDFGTWQNLQRHIYWTRCHEKRHSGDRPDDMRLPSIGEHNTLQSSRVPTVPALMQSDQLRPSEEQSVMQRLPLRTYDQDPMAILVQEPWLRDELREHCCFCRQWTAKRGGTKLHMQTLHTAEWEQTADLARAQCLQYHHLVTHANGCSFCLEPKFADKRAAMAHAQNCQVLFQLMMLTIMREEEVGLPDGLHSATMALPTGQKLRLLAAPQSRSLTSAQCSYLAKHCVVCKQYMPDPVSLKQHIRRKHPEIPIEEKLLVPQCKLLVRVEAGQCLLCRREVKKASGHTTTCLVGFQTCLSRHLLENVGAASSVRPPVPRPRADGHEQGRKSKQTIQTGSRGATNGQTQGQREREERKREKQGETRRMECLLGCTDCGPGQHGLRSGEIMPAAGRGTHGTASREGVSSSHGHLTVRDPETVGTSICGVEQPERHGDGYMQPPHLPLSSDGAGAYGEAGKASGDPAEHLRSHQGTVGDRQSTEMVVPPLESGSDKAGGGPDSGRPTAGPAHFPPGGHGCSVEARLDCSLPVQGSPTTQRGDAGRVGRFQNLGGAARTCGCDSSPGFCRPRWLHGPSVDRSQPAPREAEAMQGSQSGAGVRLRSPFLRTKLLNPPGANACYINSTILSLLHTCHSVQDTDVLLGRMATIRQVVQQSRRPLLMRDMMTFRNLLREWRAPTQQHDVGEFFQFLAHASAMGLQHHAGQAREMRGEQLRVLDTGHLGTPIPLDISFARSVPDQPHTVQDCVINHFRGQAAPVALTSAAPVICLQLKRFGFQEYVRKDTQAVVWVERELEVPIWHEHQGLGTRNVRYQITAIAVHQGDTPQSGHYQACLIDNSHEYLTNDNIAAKQLRQCDRHMVNCNSYLLFCARVD